MDAELKSTEPDHMKEKGAANIAHPRDGGSQSGSFGSGGDRTVYPSNIYAPQAQAFYYRGYESAAGEWDEYPPYINSEGLEIGSPGVYNDNPSLFFHSGYGYNPQMPYGPYSPVTTPLPSGGGDPQLYMPQQFQFSGPPYYQHLVPPSMPYIASQVPVSQPELTTLVSVDQQQGDSMLFRPRPNYPPMGSFGRGSLPANPGIIGFHDFPWGFDGLRSGGGLWSDWSKPVDRQNSFSTFSPVLSPQPISTIGLLGQNTRMGSQQQRSSYSPGNSTNSHNRFHPPSALNQGSSTGTALISSFGENNRGWIPLENARDRARVNGGSLCSCNGTLDILSEQNKGPRASRPQSQVASENNSMDNVKQRTSTGKIHDEMYNRPDFITEYKDGRFFIIKSYTEDNVHKSIKYGVWASTPNGNRKLDAAYHGSKEKQDACLVFLFFSVNASAQFCGVAEMVGPVDFDKSVDYWQQDKWSGQFPVKWHIIKDVPNSQFRHITLENNENKPVTNSRDTQEVKLEQGIEMLNIFKSYETEMSILDDFTFYEGRQKAMQERKARQQASMISAGTAGENEQRNAAFLPGDVVKQMSKSFAEVVRLDGLEEVGNKEAATDTSRVIKTGDDNGGLTEAAAVSSFAQSS